MLILGIDPGSQILGYALLEVNESCRLSILEMDVLYLKRTPGFDDRILQIFHSVNDIIEAHHPDHLAIEAPFLGKNAQSMLKLGRAQGISIAAALYHDMPYTEYEPSLIKRTVTGNGNASKQQVAALLDSILKAQNSSFEIRNPKYLDATDALAVAYTHYAVSSQQLAVNTLSPLTVKKNHKSAKKQWSDFISQNPDLVK
ncbi:MAG: crossover junction endodeoxyribonuclease RuvC [Bacteroidales bacterium]|nr:crossover junction endodeoxyribonuclease RuvC [Bacteroidales bacterium]